MKKIILHFQCLLLLSTQLHAQNKIDYDFKAKKITTIKSSGLDEYNSFRVYNINKFLYEVSISAKQTELHTEVPPIFSQILKVEKQEVSDVKKEAEATLSQQTNPSGSAAIKINASQELAYMVNNKKLMFYSDQLTYEKALPDSSADLGRIQELTQTIEKLEGEVAGQKKTIDGLNGLIQDEYTRIIGDLYLQALTVDKAFEQLEEAKVLKNRLVMIAMTDGLSFLEAKVKVDEIATKYPFSADPEKLLVSFEKAYKNFKSAYELFLANAVVAKKFKSDEAKAKASVSTLLAEVEALKSSVGKTKYEELFQSIQTLLNELRNRNNFFIVSDPVQAEKDILVFDIKITPRKNITSLSPLETRNFSAKVKVKGGLKIDFSTGIFVSTGLNNREYFSSPVSTDGLQSVIKEGKNNNVVQPSLGALMHISPRCLGVVKPGFSFGLGLTSTDISEATIFTGPSLILGSKERFIISSGLAIGRVDYLKSEYKLATEYETSKINAELTQKVTRLGWFMSFTYNLTNKEKE